MRVSIPAIEVADEVGSHGIGRPFSVYNVAIVFGDQSETLVSPAESLKTAFRLVDPLNPLLRFLVPTLDRAFEGFKIWVESDDTYYMLVEAVRIATSVLTGAIVWEVASRFSHNGVGRGIVGLHVAIGYLVLLSLGYQTNKSEGFAQSRREWEGSEEGWIMALESDLQAIYIECVSPNVERSIGRWGFIC